MFNKIVAGLLGGFIVSALAGNVVNLFTASTNASVIVFLVSWMLAIIISLKSSRGAKAWRWMLVASSALSFVVPLAALILTTKETDGAEFIGGLVATGFFGIVFFLLGLAFLVLGLLIGRNTLVVIVKEGSDKK